MLEVSVANENSYVYKVYSVIPLKYYTLVYLRILIKYWFLKLFSKLNGPEKINGIKTNENLSLPFIAIWSYEGHF